MPKQARANPTGPAELGFMRRIGNRAGFAVASIGLVFAAFQVQGTKMPQLLAAVLVVALLSVAAVAMLSVLWESMKEARRWLEERETSTAWIAQEPPGTLDYVPDMRRASKRFVKQMGRLIGDTERVGRQLDRQARLVKVAPRLGPRAAQIWANHGAKRMLRSAVFVEKRTASLRATGDEFQRAQEGLLASLPTATTDEDRAVLAEARTALAGRSAATEGTIGSVEAYRDTVRDFSQQNYSRTLRESSKRLAEQLDGMLVVLRRSRRDSERLEALFERKARAA